MGFLILLIVATAILFGCLVVSVTRFALGDLRPPVLRPSPAQPVGPQAPDGGVPGPANGAAPGSLPLDRPADDELDAEQAVREHLYGRRSRRR
jgi:hypothetical protein